MEKQTNLEKISSLTAFTPEQVAIIKATVAKNTSDTELAYFLSVCRAMELNPFLKEVWCYKDKDSNLIMFAGRDGFLSIAQRQKTWNGIVSSEVCANDVFNANIPAGDITHIPNFKDRGAIMGAYCMIRPKGCDLATIEYVELKAYNRGFGAWKTHTADMIKKVAETHCLKKAFGISGLQSEYDFQQSNGTVKTINVTEADPLEQAKRDLYEALRNYPGDDKSEISDMIREKIEADEFTLDFAQNILETLNK